MFGQLLHQELSAYEWEKSKAINRLLSTELDQTLSSELEKAKNNKLEVSNAIQSVYTVVKLIPFDILALIAAHLSTICFDGRRMSSLQLMADLNNTRKEYVPSNRRTKKGDKSVHFLLSL